MMNNKMKKKENNKNKNKNRDKIQIKKTYIILIDFLNINDKNI